MSDARDRELDRLFRAERRADEQWAPSFDRILERGAAAAGRRRRTWVPVAALAAVIVLGLAIMIKRREPIPPFVRVTVGVLRGPTDFLLDIQGAELLSSVPEVGNPVGWYPLGRSGRNGS